MGAEPRDASRGRGPWRARLVLIALFVLFVLPIVVAFALNVFAPGWQPFGRVNRGDLVLPAVALALDRAYAIDGGDAVDRAFVESGWTVVHVGAGACATRCRQALVAMRQARLALGKDAERVRRLWLVTGGGDRPDVSEVVREFPGTRVAHAPHTAAAALPAAFGTAAIVLVDPAGYAVLTYATADASALLHDLKRLLKISKQG